MNRPSAATAFRYWKLRPLPRKTAPIVGGLAAVSIAYIFAWNITGLMGWQQPVEPLARVFQVQQKWAMFSPQPPNASGWFVLSGALVDGQAIDLMAAMQGNYTQEAFYTRPNAYRRSFRSQRWNKYMSRMEWPGSPLAEPFTGYLCGLGSTGGLELVSVEMMYMNYRTDISPTPEARPRLISKVDCTANLAQVE